MHESRILRLSVTCALATALGLPTALGSDLKYPAFPPPRVDTQDVLRSSTSTSTLMLLATAPSRGAQSVASTPALRSVLELTAPPPAPLVTFARVFYSAIGQPEIPAFLRPMSPVHVYNVNTREYATFHIDATGHFPDEETKAIKHFFRCRRTGRRHTMHPGVLRMLADVNAKFPGHTIHVVSGFRAPPYGVPHSKHFRGRAIDLRIPGVKTTLVRDYLWHRYNNAVGVGWYRGQNFVHMDYRPGVNKSAWQSAHRNARYQHHPKWARK